MTEYTNAAGRVYKVKPFPPLQDAILTKKARAKWEAENGALPVVPTYEVKTASGRVEVYDHDDTTEKTEEETTAWLEYREKKASLEQSIFEQRARAAIQLIDIDPLDDQKWIDRMGWLGIEIPTNSAELLNLYAETEVIADSGRDALMLVMTTAAASGMIDQEVVKSLQEQFFRRDQRQAAGGTAEEPEKETEAGK